MKKFLDQPSDFVDDFLAGLLIAHPELKTVPGQPRAVVWAPPVRKGKTALVTGGGSGHLPLFLGYVGDGLLDGVAVGNVFASPSAQAVAAAGRATNQESGVLFIIGNYQGDKLNFMDAQEILEAEGIPSRLLTVSDDVASAPAERWTRRRGIAGLVYVYRLCGALARRGASLAEVADMGEAVNRAVKSMGVALGPMTLPEVGTPSFSLGPSDMEVGMGIHGEAGIERRPLTTAREVVNIVFERLLAELPNADRVSLLVNSLGATPPEELYILVRDARDWLADHGVNLARIEVGRFATSMEMAGVSFSLLALNPNWMALLEEPARSPLVSF